MQNVLPIWIFTAFLITEQPRGLGLPTYEYNIHRKKPSYFDNLILDSLRQRSGKIHIACLHSCFAYFKRKKKLYCRCENISLSKRALWIPKLAFCLPFPEDIIVVFHAASIKNKSMYWVCTIMYWICTVM